MPEEGFSGGAIATHRHGATPLSPMAVLFPGFVVPIGPDPRATKPRGRTAFLLSEAPAEMAASVWNLPDLSFARRGPDCREQVLCQFFPPTDGAGGFTVRTRRYWPGPTVTRSVRVPPGPKSVRVRTARS